MSKHSKILSYIDKKPLVFLIPLFLLNLGLKFYGLSFSSYYLDEAWHIFYAQMPFSELIQTALEDPNPPFYNLLIGWWSALFGVTEIGTRSLSALLSSLTAVLLFLFVRKHFNIQTAIFTVLLFTVSQIQLYYAQEARVYALVGLLTVLSFHYYMKLVKEADMKSFLLYTLVNILIIFTHLTPVFIFAVQFAGLFVLRDFRLPELFRKKGLQVISGMSLPVLAFIPWVMNSPYYNKEKATTWLFPPTLQEIKEVFITFLNEAWMYYFYIVLFVVLVLYFFVQKKRPDHLNKGVLVVLWVIIPVLINILLSNLFLPIFQPKYLLYASIGLFIFTAWLISLLPVHAIFRWGIIGIIVMYSASQLHFGESKGERWKEAATFVKKHHQEKEESLVVLSPYFQYVSFAFYYDQGFYEDYDSTTYHLNREGIYFVQQVDLFREKNVNDYEQVILITSHDAVVDPEGITLKYLRKRFEQKDSLLLGGIKCYLFETGAADKSEEIIDFDQEFQSGNQHTIVEFEQAHSGTKVTKLDREQEYSAGYQKDLSRIDPAIKQVNIEVWAYYQSPETTANLVCTLEQGDSMLVWQGLKISDHVSPGEWGVIRTQLELPATKDGARLKVYGWNTGETTVFLDDFYIRFIK